MHPTLPARFIKQHLTKSTHLVIYAVLPNFPVLLSPLPKFYPSVFSRERPPTLYMS
jgi:hypothetical protein